MALEITIDELKTIMPGADTRADLFLPFINKAMDEFNINNYDRIAMFLAQIAHESCELIYTKELADGSAYEGRTDLGNTIPGDGVRFKGRGLIQITGRANYGQCSRALYNDAQFLLDRPELLEVPKDATRSASWFWGSRNLNMIADLANEDAFKEVTKKINGGLNGYDQRKTYWIRAQEALGA